MSEGQIESWSDLGEWERQVRTRPPLNPRSLWSPGNPLIQTREPVLSAFEIALVLVLTAWAIQPLYPRKQPRPT